MAEKSTEQLEFECAELLMEMGFTEYQAYTFVSLVRLGTGTAREIADLGHVPRTRVYDAVEELHDAGLVDIKYSSPQEYTAVSQETALRKLQLDVENTVSELGELFHHLDPAEPPAEEFGVWTVTDHDAITSRRCEFIDEATEEIIYMTVDEVLTDQHLDHLAAAEDRGIDIYLAGISPAVEDRLRDRIPSVTLFETLWEWSDTGAGSLLITDTRSALVSVLLNNRSADPTEEVAIWGTGTQNSLVVVLRTIFTWRLERDEELTGAD